MIRYLLPLLAVAGAACAQDTRPLWSAGVGAFALQAPDYPAADHGALNGLGFPWLVYRGERLHIGGGNAARYIPFRTDRVELDLSLDASFGARSDDTPLRDGMADLHPLVEAGPQLIVNLSRSGDTRWILALQTRGVFSVDLDAPSVSYEGAVAKLDLQYRHADIFGPRSRLSASIGPIVATEGMQDYFYQVAPGEATATRPAFDAQAGYLGTEASLSLTYPLSERLSLWGGVGVGIWSGARNRASPLHAQDVTGQAFLGFSYTLARSERMVER
jgi:outer membrane scaffolding protein for murein synthesis (MipA/OmpV family)